MGKILTLDDLTFPNFGGDDSKKNFRIVFYLTYSIEKQDDKGKSVKGGDGKTMMQDTTIIVQKPQTKNAWQWEKENKDFYLPPKDKKSDPIELDLSRLHTNDFGFQADNYRIAELIGALKSVRVEIYDVHDTSFGEVLAKVLREVKNDLVTVVGGGIGIPKNILELVNKGLNVVIGDGKSAADKVGEKGAEQKTKDKILFSGFTDYKAGDKSVLIEGKKIWGGGKTGTYRVKMGFE